MCNFDLRMIKGLSCPVCREEFGGGNPSRNFLAEKVIRALNVLRADQNTNKRSFEKKVEKNVEKVDAEKVVFETGAGNVTELEDTENLVEVTIEHDSESQTENVSNEIIHSELPNDNLFESGMSDSPKNENNFENQTESLPGTEENVDAEKEPELGADEKFENNNSEFEEEKSEN